MVIEGKPSSRRTFAKLISDALCLRVVRVWIDRKLKDHPWIAYAILNTCEQAVLLAAGETHKTSEVQRWMVDATAPTDSALYEDILELSQTLATKL